MTSTQARTILCIALVGGLAGCGGGSNGSIGGTVSGLSTGSSVGLQDEGGDALTVNSNGGFQFATVLEAGASYAVTVAVQPANESCSVTNGSGVVDENDDDVDNVSVVCTQLLTLSGTVSGLAAGTSVTLSNGGVFLPLASNGSFSFPGSLTVGTIYAVTVSTPPAGETCSIANGSGTVTVAGIPVIVVTCS